jgi:Zn-finger protein
MGKRYPNPRLVKIHRSYTVEEVSRLLGKHKNTVRRWIKDGLPVINDKRPILILGPDLVEFIKELRAKNKQTCKPGQLYCVRCRVPKYPAGNMAEYEPVTEKVGNLIAICPDCDAIMNQRVSLAKIGEVCGKLDISFPVELRHIVKRTQPTVNSDLRHGA